ncbi:PPC domain-containing protein [Histidinibacterium aquaticum]|uniref:ABC transporter substrate-binding protein n=1 Tax=Histidinibacterium aquaticum TaxID=2613962 RepID=A0A5J5GDU8_9RHOB|nr:PPC domain-containing protein [Histidinibacterium aquaticum]KAA9006058.1 ABC transporter substrate-binding protein [Histidinibacterium aquaticum]
MTLKPLTILGALAAGTVALPASAQEYCGGLSSGAWIGGNEANSDIGSAETFREQLALVLLGNAHTSLFSLSEAASVRLEAEARGQGDPVIEVLDGEGGVVATDDDSGGGVSSAALVALEPGTYCLQTSSYDNAPLTATVRIGRAEHEALTEGGATLTAAGPGDTTETPAPTGASPVATDTEACGGAVMLASGPLDDSLSQGVSRTESIEAVPTYAFDLASPASVSITAENPDADPVLTLTGDDGTFYAENDDYDGLNSRIDMTTPLAAGTYCVQLRALSDATAPVTVSVSGFDPEAAAQETYNRGQAAPPLDGSYPVTDLGTLSGRVVTDAQIQGETAQWFSVTLDAPGLLLVEAIGAAAGGDPVLRVFDDVGREIAYNDDYGQSYDSQIAARTFPGTYLIALTDISATSPLLRLVIERYVPAE